MTLGLDWSFPEGQRFIIPEHWAGAGQEFTLSERTLSGFSPAWLVIGDGWADVIEERLLRECVSLPNEAAK